MSGRAKSEREQAFNAGVGRRIAEVRKALGLQQGHIAEAVGCTRSNISNWEVGVSGVPPFRLPALAAALGVGVDDLIPKELVAALPPPRPLVTVKVRTRHPEDYELVNHADGTRWEIHDGAWRRKAT